MTRRRVLVTGGAGFIGSHIADAYLERGDDVWIVDDLSSGKRENVPADAEFIEMSIEDERLDTIFEDVGFDILNHHAAQIDVRKSVADPRHDARINIDGLLNLLECARRHATQRVLFVSSGGVVYGEPEERPTPETAPKRPLSPYGVSKLAAEYYLAYYREIHGLDYVALRYSNVYGPRQDPHGEAGVVAIFSTRIAGGQPLTVFGDGEQTRDYIYIDDVVAANMLFSEHSVEGSTLDGRAFNVATGRESSVIELAETLSNVAGRDTELDFAPARPGELRHSCLNTTRIQQLGWTPKTPLADGLAQTYASITAREVSR